MASASAPIDQRNGANSQKSHFQRPVCLVDWWLIEAENGAQGRGLAVAGSTSRENQAMRVFSSAPILKRYDVFNLETTDGICVILNGHINKDHTLRNGFPSNVCDYFTYGFPPYWKEYYDKFMVEDRQIPADSLEKDFGSQGKMDAKVEGRQMPADNLEKDFGSQGKMDAKVEGRQMPADSHEKDFGSQGKMNAEVEGRQMPADSHEKDFGSQGKMNAKVEGRQMPADSHEKDFGSQGKMDAKGIRESKKGESGKNNTTKAKFDRDSKGVLTRKAKAVGVETKRKFAHVSKKTPDGTKRVPNASPESNSINRSRSGRLLMPTLEFWRNQRAVYDADRSITEIKQGSNEQPKIRTPQKIRKRKRKSTRTVRKRT